MHWHLLVFHDKDKKQFTTQQDPTKWMSLYVHVHLLNAFNWIMHNDSLCSHSFIINGLINGNSDASLQSWLQTVLYDNLDLKKKKLLLCIVYHFMWKTYIMCLYVLFLKYFEKNNIQVSWTYTRMLGVTFKNTASLLLHKLFARVHKLSCIIIMCVEAMFIEEVLG